MKLKKNKGRHSRTSRFFRKLFNMQETSDLPPEETPIVGGNDEDDANNAQKDVPVKKGNYGLEQDEDLKKETNDVQRFNDLRGDKTYGRRIAGFFSRMKCIGGCYNPSQNRKPLEIPSDTEMGARSRIIGPPSLDKAWEYFEHYTLPRYLTTRVDPETNKVLYARAKPGEDDEPTSLYPVWKTPLKDLGDLGTGVAMYFDAVRYFGVVAFLAGILSIPSILYFMNDYSPDGKEDISNSLNKASSICTATSWKPCPNCTLDILDAWPTENYVNLRVANGTAADGSGDEVFFILSNDCDLNETYSILTLVTVLFFAVATLIFIYHQRRLRAKLDEGDQTTSDYSVLIKNPPQTREARDPEQWKAFFEKSFDDVHVTICTVALDNEELLNKLVKRRKLLTKLKNLLPPQVDYCAVDLEKTVLSCPEPNLFLRLLGFSAGPKHVYDRIKKLEEDIARLGELSYPVSSVFVTFETEEMQRRVLQAMSYPKLCKKSVPTEYRFDRTWILKVVEPDEPSSIRWKDLDESPKLRLFQRCFTFALTCALIGVGAACIGLARTHSVELSAIIIILLNVISPHIVRFLTRFESHINESTYHSSAYIKVTLIRWVNTVIVTALITPFTYTLMDGDHLIEQLRVLFTAELVQRPILQLTDWMGNVKRHIFAPRARNQTKMNILFMSHTYSIGERYTDLTKLLFLTCFYAPIYPAAWWFTTLILFVYYWIDKFCVLRTWRQGAKIGSDISIISVYFFLGCVVTYSLLAAYNFAMFPFDSVCKTDVDVPSKYVGDYNNGAFSIAEGDKAYEFCDQDLFRTGIFPPLASNIPYSDLWMTDLQKKYLPLYAWISIAMVVLAATFLFFRLIVVFVLPLCSKKRKFATKASEQPFSKVENIKGYVPQICINGHLTNVLACDERGIEELIGWEVSENEQFDNLIDDMHQVLDRRGDEKNRRRGDPTFSQVRHWHPAALHEIETKLSEDTAKITAFGSMHKFFLQ